MRMRLRLICASKMRANAKGVSDYNVPFGTEVARRGVSAKHLELAVRLEVESNLDLRYCD